MRSCRMLSFKSSSSIIQRDQEENGQFVFSQVLMFNALLLSLGLMDPKLKNPNPNPAPHAYSMLT